MKPPTIYLAFTDDWELRGDGSGDLETLQIKPMRQLLEIFDNYEIKATFMAEVMQQLTFRERQKNFPELRELADRWDGSIYDAFRRGHDVQLHIHPQWSSADYTHGSWRLTGDWSLLNYEPAAAGAMIFAGKRYVEKLLRPIDPSYSCVAFRSGSSVIAPSPFILQLLADAGIVFDISIVGGLRVNTANLHFDYIDCEEDLLPFYPDMTDARKVSEKVEPIVCVPIFHFTGSRLRVVAQLGSKLARKLKKQSSAKHPGSGYAKDQWVEIGRSSFTSRLYDKAVGPALHGKHLTADIGRLDYPLLCEMIGAIREKAKATGLDKVPVVLTNHTKDMTDFVGFDRFLLDLSRAHDIKFVTLSDLAKQIKAGEFAIRKAGTHQEVRDLTKSLE
jgi:hypothetical protein